MMKIRIPVEEVHQKTKPFAGPSALRVIPMIAIALLVGFSLGKGVMLPQTDPRMQIGAALESTQKTNTDEILVTENIESNLPKAALGNPKKREGSWTN
jgi:hypothetical protein